jgi:hypothetical protein
MTCKNSPCFYCEGLGPALSNCRVAATEFIMDPGGPSNFFTAPPEQAAAFVERPCHPNWIDFKNERFPIVFGTKKTIIHIN